MSIDESVHHVAAFNQKVGPLPVPDMIFGKSGISCFLQPAGNPATGISEVSFAEHQSAHVRNFGGVRQIKLHFNFCTQIFRNANNDRVYLCGGSLFVRC